MNWQTRKVINKGFSDSNQIQYYEFVENNQQIHERTLRVCQHFLCPKTAKSPIKSGFFGADNRT